MAAHPHGKERALSPAQGNGDRGCYTTLDAPNEPVASAIIGKVLPASQELVSCPAMFSRPEMPVLLERR